MPCKLKLLSISLAFLPLLATAQKQPKIQNESVRAPQSVKIDGKLSEWNNGFQAYNSGQHIYYTISNDANNLYFVAQMDDFIGYRKIFSGGLDFAIMPESNSGKKITINFPVIAPERDGVLERRVGNPVHAYNSLPKNNAAKNAVVDSLVLAANNELWKSYKYLYVTGIPEITDTLISVYNTQGIMAAAGFDQNMRYTYELAIPLKYLPTPIKDAKSIKYNIKLRATPVMFVQPPPSANTTVVSGYRVGPPNIDDQFLSNDTDFSGEYTLAPKR